MQELIKQLNNKLSHATIRLKLEHYDKCDELLNALLDLVTLNDEIFASDNANYKQHNEHKTPEVWKRLKKLHGKTTVH